VNERTRAVLDTDIFISAALQPEGPPGRLVQAFIENAAFELVLSAAIAEEVRRALAYPKLQKYLPRDLDPGSWLEALLMLAEIVPGAIEVEGVCEDPDDDKFIAAALEGRATFVVTGDRKLLAVSRYESIHIVGPRAFLDALGF
jgi:putative PIN family toxin of toxin-antitoxin system